MSEAITKQFLRHYSMLLDEIDDEQERLNMIEEKLVSDSASIGDGMPHSMSKEPDKMGMRVIIKDELQNRLEELRHVEQIDREKIENALMERTEISQERMLIRLRYIDRMDWVQIRKVMFGRRKDYYSQEERYERLVFRIHGNVLEKLLKNISK